MGKGDVRIVRDDEEKRRCLDLLLDHVTGSAARRTYSPQSLLLTNIYVLSVTEMTGKRRS
jgi:nitroimidazol reductase NimA-like FMN-containing flavoprotein (pyridoxamine 5'-phosphate oxidase superfamily)